MAARRRVTPIVAVSGPSGSGKTTLLTRLIPALVRRGIRVGALKHSGHPHSFDVPGKDSARMLASGAVAVVVQGPAQRAWFGPPGPGGARAMARLLPPCDLVLAEGFRSERLPRIEVHRRAVGAPFLCARDRRVIAVVADEPPPRRLPTFDLDDVEGVAAFLADRLRRRRRAARRGRDST